MVKPIPDWQLPRGVDHGLWQYLHNADLAQGYDERLRSDPLCAADVAFCAARCAQPGRLLDLGCGTGRLLIPFAQQGWWCLGVDLSDEMLRVAARRAQEAGVHVNLLKANLVELDGLTAGSFDLAACLFSTLGMIRGTAARRQVIEHVYRLLRPGGQFVLHVHNRWFSLHDPAGRRWFLRDVIRSSLGAPDAGDRSMPIHQGVAGLTLHHFYRREALKLLRTAGFRIRVVQPMGLGAGGQLAWSWFFTRLRAYGYLIAAEKP